MPITINPRLGEFHNLEIRTDHLLVREGWRVIATGLTGACSGFSIEAGNTGETWHYVVARDSNGNGTLSVYEEDFGTSTIGGTASALYSVQLGKIPEDCPVYYSETDQQLIVNSPGFDFALYGIVGGGLKRATSDASINPDTSAITIPTGIVCSFEDRPVIGSGRILYIADPGDPKTFTAENEIALDGTIYHLQHTDDGFLAAFTNNGIFALPRDALGQGQFAVGALAKVPGYEAQDYRCAADSNGITAVLVRDGVAALQQSLALLPMQAYHRKRRFTDYVGQEDFRYGRIHATANGFLVRYPRHSLVIDIKHNYRSWFYDKTNTVSILSVLSTREGRDLYLTSSGKIIYPIGTADEIDTTVDGYSAIETLTDPAGSQMVREIHPSSDNPGLLQYAYLSGTATSGATANPSGQAIVIGTDKWSASGMLGDREIRSRRLQVAVRTDFLSLEIGAQGSGREVGLAAIVTKPSGLNRPNQ